MVRISIWLLAIALASSSLAAQPPAPPSQAPASTGQAPQAAPARQGAPPAPSPAGQAPAPAGQAPQAPARQGGPAPAGRGAAPPPTEQVGFTYNPEGRRDPFRSLLGRGGDPRGPGPGGPCERPGLPCLGVDEVTLRGTVKSREGFVAILQGVDQKTYIARPGDKLRDGTVRTISQNELCILQPVNDPLSSVREREVCKVLRQPEAN